MILPFFKYHGTGNDFILIDNRTNDFKPDRTVVEFLCDRRFGIGADGLMLLGHDAGFDFHMTYFNSDGRESSMCGNGGRCMIAFANYLKIIDKEASFNAIDGTHTGKIIGMLKDTPVISLKMRQSGEMRMQEGGFLIDTGSPHLVRFMTGVEEADVASLGRQIRYSKTFEKEGINVDFVEVRPEGLFVRTYERGVENETLSCGTGVTAAALASALQPGKDDGQYRVNITTPGGDLVVEFLRKGNIFENIWLTGPATRVFEGKMEI